MYHYYSVILYNCFSRVNMCFPISLLVIKFCPIFYCFVKKSALYLLSGLTIIMYHLILTEIGIGIKKTKIKYNIIQYFDVRITNRYFHSYSMKFLREIVDAVQHGFQWNCCEMYQGRKLDCVYYYMRSLAASNPFLSARESLMQLFDDAARKVL